MRDMHCHILPGVDDGAANLSESLAMLEAAQSVGITSIVCTPHVRDPYFNYRAMWDAFYLLEEHAHGFPLYMGFEVNHSKLMQFSDQQLDVLGFENSNEFLLELPSRSHAHDFDVYESTIFHLQGMGFEVIIAHPERCHAIQDDPDIAVQLVDMGCKLQVSSDFVEGGRFGEEKKPAIHLLKEGLVSYIASDAHKIGHYDAFAKAVDRYAQDLRV